MSQSTDGDDIMSKRSSEMPLPDDRDTKRLRPAEPGKWFLRLAELRPEGNAKRYGVRFSRPLSAFCNNTDDLIRYSLVIPCITRRRDIPTGKPEQRGQTWLWNTLKHPRYFGLLDLDMELDAVKEGKAALFNDGPACVYEDMKAVKQAFAARLMQPGTTFGHVLACCPAFAALYRTVTALCAAMTVEHLTYFSGGGGFRVLFHTPLAWRTVTWGHTYAIVFCAQHLRPLLCAVAPTLDTETLGWIVAATDKNIYDCDKGTKPDLLAHFDTLIYPKQVDAEFEDATPSRTMADEVLSRGIRDFWRRVFLTVPEEAPLELVAEIDKPAMVQYKQVLHAFPKSKNIKEATHFVMQGKHTSYRRVDDTTFLYTRMLAQCQRQQPLNAHEIRTPVTRHTVDYDGGPPLLLPMRRSDKAEDETPLHAIQEITHSMVLAPKQEFSGLLVSCPPRAGTQGARAHLIWPEWYVRMEDEDPIMSILRCALSVRWPSHDWKHILESPPKMRMLFSDTMDRKTGLMANRAMQVEAVFDVDAQTMGVRETWPETTDMDLLHLCSLRVDDDTKELATLLPLPVAHTNKDTSGASSHASLNDLPEKRRAAVRVTLQTALEAVRLKHDKPKAQLYGEHAIYLVREGKYRRLVLGLLNHHQCTKATKHENNNVRLILYMDRPYWEIRCMKKECPQYSRADWTWGRGDLDTSALAAAWPPPGTESIPPGVTIETPPPSPPHAHFSPPPLSEDTPCILVPPEQWDGRSVVLKETDMPTSEWTWVRLTHESGDARWLLDHDIWSRMRCVHSRMHACQVRFVPYSHLKPMSPAKN